jgi:hypothetical protein
MSKAQNVAASLPSAQPHKRTNGTLNKQQDRPVYLQAGEHYPAYMKYKACHDALKI